MIASSRLTDLLISFFRALYGACAEIRCGASAAATLPLQIGIQEAAARLRVVNAVRASAQSLSCPLCGRLSDARE
jgi:hypothetical protein